jgi:fibronectin-binding autotransporter adhesin
MKAAAKLKSSGKVTLHPGLLITIAVLALVALGLIQNAQATPRTWSGGGDKVSWNDGANWNPAGAPASGDALSLNSSIPISMGIGANIGALSISFANNFNGSNTTVIGGNGATPVTLTLDSSWSVSDNASSGQITFQSLKGGLGALSMPLNGAGTVTVASGATMQFLSQIDDGSSAGSITKEGGGTFVLGNGSNTYSGGTTVDAGVLQTTATQALGSTSAPLTVNGGNTVSGNFPTTLDLHGTNQIVGGLSGNTVSSIGGRIENDLSNTSSVLTVGTGNASATFNGIIFNGSGTTGLIKVGTGTQALAGTNTYTGDTTVSAGTLKFTGVSSAIGNVSVASGATLDASNTGAGLAIGALSGQGSVAINTPSLGLNVSQSTSATFSGVISGSGMVNKGGGGNGGSETFTGANTYGGGTDIHSGTLLINNTSGSGTGSGAVNVFAGILGGTGFISSGANNVTVNQGANITGGDNGTIGTLHLTTANLVFNGQMFDLATYVVDLSNTSSDKLAITGNLDLSGGFDQISFQGTAGAPSYELATFTGTRTGTFDTVTNLPAGYMLEYNPGQIDLVQSISAVPEPATWVGGALALLVIGCQFSVIRRRRHLRSRK